MERGRRKLFLGLAVIMVFLMASGVLAETIGLSDNVKDIVNNIVEKQGISEEQIESIEEVSFDDLPEQIDLENIDTTNLAIYKVDYGTDKPVFVLTVSDETSVESKKIPGGISKMMLLNFGNNGMMEEPEFLDTATGVKGSLEKGYVMMRDGSITGLSTNLEVISGSGDIEIVIYKNGEAAGFRNTISGDSAEVKTDYDVQSLGTVNFEKGDVLSVYVKSEGDVVWKDVITLVEIATE